MNDTKNRRPLASRQTQWAQGISRWLATTPLTPNRISMASMLAAAIVGGCFWGAGNLEGWTRAAVLVAAAVFCQVRLLCNLFDGMVAIESGKKEADGPFWNEFPDRIADMLILVGAGLGVGEPALGWAAGSMAVLTAYTRELGQTCGLPADFSGPMAKQHRMAAMTVAAVAAALASPFTGWSQPILFIALWVVAVGAAVTAARRAAKIIASLRQARDRTG